MDLVVDHSARRYGALRLGCTAPGFGPRGWYSREEGDLGLFPWLVRPLRAEAQSYIVPQISSRGRSMPEQPKIDADTLNERIHEELKHEGGTLLKAIALTTALFAALGVVAVQPGCCILCNLQSTERSRILKLIFGRCIIR